MTKVIIGTGVRVEAYYNLHKRCLSYRARGGRVRHADALILNDVRFAVQPAGRARVLMEYRKNVHAFVRGKLEWSGVHGLLGDYTEENMRRQGYSQITYNPYNNSSFVYRDTGEPIHSATQVVIIGSHIYLSGRDTTNER
jgi:hypothetical protein